MSTTFIFEELDDATHDYLVAVRESEGIGSPGVFAATSDSLPGCGCIAGPIVIAVTLMLTLTTWLDVIYKEPVNVAFLQTAGLLVGGWLLVAGFRAGKGSNKVAGTWVYVDPLYLYEAYREQVTVTPIDEVVEANFTHNYNNGNYQNSVVNISLGGNRGYKVTLANEARAEQMVVYLNYIAWARGPDGGERANLPPATLGGLAKYVAKNDHEPLDAESNINLNLIELDITEVPEQPSRENRATPAFVPYIVMLVAAGVCFCVMAFGVNPKMRDDAIYDDVMKHSYVGPQYVRRYLLDQRNTAHREEVAQKVSSFYDAPINHVRQNGKDRVLSEGMAKILESVRTADQALVSIRVTEKGNPPGKADTRSAREADLRTQFVYGINGEFSNQFWGRVAPAPDGGTWTDPPPPIGTQFLTFIEQPEGAANVHFDIEYTVEPVEGTGQYRISVKVDLRTNIEDGPVASTTFAVPGTFELSAFDGRRKTETTTEYTACIKIKDELVSRMVGLTPGLNNVPGMPGMPGFPQPAPPVFEP